MPTTAGSVRGYDTGSHVTILVPCAVTIIDVTSLDLFPKIPSPLPETSAAALEWPRLRDPIAGRTFSPLGRAWVLALEPSADLAWIDQQQQRTAEMRSMLAAAAASSSAASSTPPPCSTRRASTAAALEATEIRDLLTVVERVAAWRNLIVPPRPARMHQQV